MFNIIDRNISRPLEEAHTEHGHFYRHEKTNKLYTSITTIFKLLEPAEESDWYPHWINKIMRDNNITKDEAIIEAKRIGKSSMEVGIEMHRLAEEYLQNMDTSPFDISKFEKNPIELFNVLKPWLDENIDEVHGVEFKLYSDELETAGTVDLVARLKTGEMVIIDFKNSRNPKTLKKCKDSHYFEQIAAYAKMWEYCTGEKIGTGIVVVISWDNKVRPFRVKLADHEYDLWKKIIDFEHYKCLNNIK